MTHCWSVKRYLPKCQPTKCLGTEENKNCTGKNPEKPRFTFFAEKEIGRRKKRLREAECVCVCETEKIRVVCVCVGVRERERERKD